MKLESIFLILALGLVFSCLISPVTATQILSVDWKDTNIYSENENFHLVKNPEPPLTKESQTPKTVELDVDGNRIVLYRYPLVSITQKSIDFSIDVETAGTTIRTDLENAKITFNGKELTDTYIKGKGELRISGLIPNIAKNGEKIYLIYFEDLGEIENNVFAVYAISESYSNAKIKLYEAVSKWKDGETKFKEKAKDPIARAINDFSNEDFNSCIINAENALTILESGPEWYEDGYNTGISIGLITAVFLAAVVGGILFYLGRKITMRPDLLKLEELIEKYFSSKEKKKPIDEKVEKVLRKAFEYNPSATGAKGLFQLFYDERDRAVKKIEEYLKYLESTEKQSKSGGSKSED